jgi:maleate cis-trans isomerase
MPAKPSRKHEIGVIFPDEGAYPYELLDQEFMSRWFTDHGYGSVGYRIERTPGGKPLNIADCAELAREDQLVPAARRQAEAGSNVILWACVSASFHYGLDYARRQARMLSTDHNLPATSASLAIVAAVEHLGAKKVDVMMNYMPEVADAFLAFLSEAGLEVVDVRHMACRIDQRAFDLDYKAELAAFSSALSPRDHPVIIPSTSLSSLAAIRDFEQIAQRPVVTANLACVWHALRLLGLEGGADRAGSLLSIRT